jgi:hypothetical protein
MEKKERVRKWMTVRGSFSCGGWSRLVPRRCPLYCWKNREKILYVRKEHEEPVAVAEEGEEEEETLRFLCAEFEFHAEIGKKGRCT